MGILTTVLNNNKVKIDNSIGQGSNQIKTAGLHLVQIKEFRIINEEKPRLSVKFASVKDKREIAQNLFLVNSASGPNTTNSVQNSTAEFMINVVSLALNKANIIFAGGANSIDELFVKSEPLDKPTGAKIETFTIPTLLDKQIYIATHIQITQMGKDSSKQPMEKQTIDPKYVFNINKLTKTEVANKIELPGTFDTATTEMLSKVSFEKAAFKNEPMFKEKYLQVCARLGIAANVLPGKPNSMSPGTQSNTMENSTSDY